MFITACIQYQLKQNVTKSRTSDALSKGNGNRYRVQHRALQKKVPYHNRQTGACKHLAHGIRLLKNELGKKAVIVSKLPFSPDLP